MRRYPALFVMFFFFFYSLTTSDAILKRTTAKVCDCAYADIEFAFRVFFFNSRQQYTRMANRKEVAH